MMQFVITVSTLIDIESAFSSSSEPSCLQNLINAFLAGSLLQKQSTSPYKASLARLLFADAKHISDDEAVRHLAVFFLSRSSLVAAFSLLPFLPGSARVQRFCQYLSFKTLTSTSFQVQQRKRFSQSFYEDSLCVDIFF